MWNVIHCAVQGRGHVKNNIPCQDKTYSIFINGVNVVALSDGAGSAKLSHFGAENTVKNICFELAEEFDNFFYEEDGIIIKNKILSKTLERLTKLSLELNCELKDLASTLLFVAIKEDRFILSHIGDGVIGYLKDGEIKIATQPENGEFINTTVFTTSKNAINTMKIIKGKLGTIKSFILMSDGSENSFYDKKEKKLTSNLKKIIQKMIIGPIINIQEKLEKTFKDIIIQKTSDDCSIAIMVDENMELKDLEKIFVKKMKIRKCEKRAHKIIKY